MIYILTGPKQSGKTTRLSEWIKKQDGKISGILSPIEDDVRYFYSISSDRRFPFSVIDNNYKKNEVVLIGKYAFYKKAFEIAIDEIEKGLKQDSDYIIIDEIGPLELQKKGFYNITKRCIDISRSKKKYHFIFVIRDSLLNEFIDFFNIKKGEFEIINTESIFNIRN